MNLLIALVFYFGVLAMYCILCSANDPDNTDDDYVPHRPTWR